MTALGADEKTKLQMALIETCTHLPDLELLLQDAPPNILECVVQRFAELLPNDLNSRCSFARSGGLQKIQGVRAEVGSKLHDCIDEINMMYPPEIVQYYSPNYTETLLYKYDLSSKEEQADCDAWLSNFLNESSESTRGSLAEADVLQRLLKVLPNDLNSRCSFARSGGLQKIQEVNAEVGSKLHDYIDEINMLYPPEIVMYYSPNYAETLLKKMDEFN